MSWTDLASRVRRARPGRVVADPGHPGRRVTARAARLPRRPNADIDADRLAASLLQPTRRYLSMS